MTKDPDKRTTQSGLSVCSFTVAVNRKRAQDQAPETDFFRVTAWRQLADTCAKYLAKGRKVCVIGPVSVSTYQANDGKTRATLEVSATDVEFLTPRDELPALPPPKQEKPMADPEYLDVDEDDLPF